MGWLSGLGRVDLPWASVPRERSVFPEQVIPCSQLMVAQRLRLFRKFPVEVIDLVFLDVIHISADVLAATLQVFLHLFNHALVTDLLVVLFLLSVICPGSLMRLHDAIGEYRLREARARELALIRGHRLVALHKLVHFRECGVERAHLPAEHVSEAAHAKKVVAETSEWIQKVVSTLMTPLTVTSVCH